VQELPLLEDGSKAGLWNAVLY